MISNYSHQSNHLLCEGSSLTAGIKVAKLEIKVILAMVLLGYEYKVMDDNSNYPKAVLDQDRNDLLQVSYPPAWHFKSLNLCFFS